MVGAIKRWLGIDKLERENLQLARSLQSAHKKIANLQQDQKETLAALVRLEKDLTSEPAKPKIVADKPKRMTWRGTVAAIERANEKEQAEA